MKIILILLICLYSFSDIKKILLRVMGYKIGKRACTDMSFIYANHVEIEDDVIIKHFNYMLCSTLIMGKISAIYYYNSIKCPINILLHEKA